jgi:hypothetical protein
MLPVKETVRVPYTVEKRVPVTYTCYTPRVVCYQVPLDACGMPMTGMPAVVSGSERLGTSGAQGPTPAASRKADAADQTPELSPGTLPRPLNPGESSAEGGKGPIRQERLSPVPTGPEEPKKEKQPSGSKGPVSPPGKQA